MKKLNCILLVDDDHFTNLMHSDLIREAGVDVHIQVALNGKDALDFLTHRGAYENSTAPCPGIILLDINMPVMDGWEFLDAFEKLDVSIKKDILLLMMLTTSLNPDDKKRALSISAINDYCGKPLSMETLKDAIERYNKMA